MRHRKFRGFTLIELLVLISLFALISGAITVSYLSFERRQRLKNAVEQVKVDLRWMQNNALTGNKGIGSGVCSSTERLAGWVFYANEGDDHYERNLVCKKNDLSEYFPSSITVDLPNGIIIGNISYWTTDFNDGDGLIVLFWPLTGEAFFINQGRPYLNADYTLNLSKLWQPSGKSVVLTIWDNKSGESQQVTILPNGTIN